MQIMQNKSQTKSSSRKDKINHKKFKTLGHHLKPVLIIADKGINANIITELNRALDDHELIKVSIRIDDRLQRRSLIDELCTQSKAHIIQIIGKIALLYRKNPKAKFSNII